MPITKKAQEYHKKMFPNKVSTLAEKDPEFVELFDNFAFDEVVNSVDLDHKTRMIAILATLLGCQGIDEFKVMVDVALNFDVSPIEIKEIVYQATAYLGIGRIFPFIHAVNTVFTEKGIPLPLENQSTTTAETRLMSGNKAQVEIFGDSMKDFHLSGSKETQHINYWLTANCFGDYYTRKGLNLAQRELITFCFLFAQGGCESQLISHSVANMRIGNSKSFLIKVISQCVPFIGYPRCLNAIACLNKASETT